VGPEVLHRASGPELANDPDSLVEHFAAHFARRPTLAGDWSEITA